MDTKTFGLKPDKQISKIKDGMKPSAVINSDQLKAYKKKVKRNQVKQIMGLDFYNPKKLKVKDLKQRFLLDETESLYR